MDKESNLVKTTFTCIQYSTNVNTILISLNAKISHFNTNYNHFISMFSIQRNLDELPHFSPPGGYFD